VSFLFVIFVPSAAGAFVVEEAGREPARITLR